ncbi:hypothetical protein [Urbifossiella limnaea]|uniref:Uncharacterized protein n=1 Tax=Urbifossiella limnaea TaxID=2528023 RepID=A0A517XS55_9BACT|nr:hypothetical protein [Urbifossiella limnaea]QDU20338.1 hypothetical protein ETAA1_22900 [Urbifossiella limnaea]
MFLRCICGNSLDDIASPSPTVRHVLTDTGIEKLQDAVDQEVAENGIVDMWPEHWETAGTQEVWLCSACERLYIGVNGSEPIRVYKLEQVGLNE